MKAYLFWYICCEYGRTEYIWIIAYSIKQARYFFFKNGYGENYDYSISPVDERQEKDFVIHHKVGEILGDMARI